MSFTMHLFNNSEELVDTLLILIAGEGVYIEKWGKSPRGWDITISVPEHSYKKDFNGEIAGERLVQTMKKFLNGINKSHVKFKYTIREGEYWTSEMGRAAEIAEIQRLKDQSGS